MFYVLERNADLNLTELVRIARVLRTTASKCRREWRRLRARVQA